jgi:hypothetical protein
VCKAHDYDATEQYKQHERDGLFEPAVNAYRRPLAFGTGAPRLSSDSGESGVVLSIITSNEFVAKRADETF